MANVWIELIEKWNFCLLILELVIKFGFIYDNFEISVRHLGMSLEFSRGAWFEDFYFSAYNRI